jgi:hypothetical protein
MMNATMLDANTIQLNASATKHEVSEENCDMDSSPIQIMLSDWSLTNNSSPLEEENSAIDRGARRRLDKSLLSSSDEDSSDSNMEFLLTRE